MVDIVALRQPAQNIFWPLQACMSSLYQRNVFETCGCYDPAYPRPQEAEPGMDDKCKILISGTLN